MKNPWNLSPRRAAVCALSALFCGLLGASSPAAAQDAAAPAGLCNTANSPISAMFLVDESTSLALTDTSLDRVTGVQDALTMLRDAAVTQGRSVNVSIVGFGVAYQAALPWTELSDATLPEMHEAANTLAERMTAIDTDYATALGGAQADFAEQVDPANCELLIIATDGGYSIGTRTETTGASFGITKPYAPDARLDSAAGTEQAIDAGTEQLCGAGGVIDQLRTSGVSINTIALQAALRDGEAAFIDSLSGGSTAQPCGEEAANGTSLAAATGEELRSGIGQIVAASVGASDSTSTSLSVCQLLGCPQGTVTIDVDEGVGRVVIGATFDSPAKLMMLTDPSGVTATFAPDADTEQKIGSSTVTGAFDAATGSLTVVADSGTTLAQGGWEVVVIDSEGTGIGTDPVAAVVAAQYPAVTLAVTSASAAAADADFTMSIAATDASGAPVAADTLAETTATATIIDGVSGAEIDVPLTVTDGGFTGQTSLPSDFSGTGTVTIDANVQVGADAVASTITQEVGPATEGATPAPGGNTPVESPESGSGFFSLLSVLLIAVCAAVIGIAVLWARANRKSLFNLDDVRVAEMNIAVRASGQVDRIEHDETARQLYIRGSDFAAVGRGNSRTFAAGRLRFAGNMSIMPNASVYGVAVGNEPVIGQLGTEESGNKIGGIISTNLEGQWLFELNESRTAFANQSGENPTGDLYGRLVVFVHGSLDETSPKFGDLAEDVIVRSRQLAKMRKPATGVDLADDNEAALVE